MLAAPACVSQRIVAPDRPPIAEALPEDLSGVSIAIREFEVINQTSEDVIHDGKRKLERAFFDYLRESAVYGLVLPSAKGPVRLPEDAVQIDVSIKVEEETNRTYVFDAMFFYPFLGTLPFTPIWGNAWVDLSLKMHVRGRSERPIEVKVMSPYSIIFYSWYRVGPIEDAFRRAHDAAFREVTKRLASRLAVIDKQRRAELALRELAETSSRAVTQHGFEAWLAAQLPAAQLPAAAAPIAEAREPARTSTASTGALAANTDPRSPFIPLGAQDLGELTDNSIPDIKRAIAKTSDGAVQDRLPIPTLAVAREPEAPPASPPAATSASALLPAPAPALPPPSPSIPPSGGRELLRLEPEGVNVIDQPFTRREPPGFWERYVGSLGGIEASVTGGIANVESGATTSSGLSQVVGSGRATSRGYRVALYKPPDRTGFFFPPVIGFLSQEIKISGFREDIPLFIPEGTNTIPAVVTDPTTGLPVDADEPISYDLDLKSGFIGQGIGLNLVLGTEDVQLFTTMRAGINIAEFRYSRAQIHVNRTEGNKFVFFQSGSVGGQIGLAIPAIHAALRAAVNYEWYRQFDYPQPVEFQAKVAFNREKQVFERERVFVNNVALQTLDWQLSLVALF